MSEYECRNGHTFGGTRCPVCGESAIRSDEVRDTKPVPPDEDDEDVLDDEDDEESDV